MEKIAQTRYYGYDYTIYRTKYENNRFYAERHSIRKQTSDSVYFNDERIVDNIDDDAYSELVNVCQDRIFLRTIFTKHRACQNALCKLFSTRDKKMSQGERKRQNTK